MTSKYLGRMLCVFAFSGQVALASESVRVLSMGALHSAVCENSQAALTPWSLRQLYDCSTRALFIPYQLWTGAPWDGNRDAPCMHSADTLFNVNGRSTTTIQGPREWTNPVTGEKEIIWIRDKVSGRKTQYFTCHEKGVGRVHDSRWNSAWGTGRCKFPAGYGWRISERRYCVDTSIEIVAIEMNGETELTSMEFKWWYGENFDHIYKYAPEKGMLNAWKQ